MNGEVLVFANGDLEDVAWVRPYLERATAVIAANGGSTHLWRLDHLPQVVIGDLDSLPDHVRDWLSAAGVPFITHDEDKDETDLELALLHALQIGAEEILVFAAFGGRFDQTLANILLLAHPALSARRVELVTRYERAWLINSRTEIRGAVGDRISLVPLGGAVHVRQTEGLKWVLQDELLDFGPARGISNSMTADTATVEIKSGKLLCIHSKKEWRR